MIRTRRGARKPTVKIEDEIKTFEELALSHRREIKNHQRKLAQENKAFEEASKKIEELRTKQIQEVKKQEQRRRQEEKERDKKKNAYVQGIMERDGDLPWEKMDQAGVCKRCCDKGLDCYRVIESADTRRNLQHVTNLMKVRIGKWTYSRCQECRLSDGKCILSPRHSDDIAESVRPDIVVDSHSVNGKRKRQATPDTPNTRVKVEPRERRPGQLLTPSSESSLNSFRVIPGSNSHFAIPVQTTPGPSKQPSSVSQKEQEVEKGVRDLRDELRTTRNAVRELHDEHRTTREILEVVAAHLGIHGGRGGVRAGGSKQIDEDRDLSYVSESE